MSIASHVNVPRQKHQCLTPETPASIGGKFRFLHKQRISIENRSISIRILCRIFLFRKKAAGRRVREKAFFPPFCHEASGWCFTLQPCTQPERSVPDICPVLARVRIFHLQELEGVKRSYRPSGCGVKPIELSMYSDTIGIQLPLPPFNSCTAF